MQHMRSCLWDRWRVVTQAWPLPHTSQSHLTHLTWVRTRLQSEATELLLVSSAPVLDQSVTGENTEAAALTAVQWVVWGCEGFHHAACAEPTEWTEGERCESTMNSVPWRSREVGCTGKLWGAAVGRGGGRQDHTHTRTHTQSYCWSSALKVPTSPFSLHEDMKSS